MLAVRQVQKQLLAFNEVSHRFAGQLAGNGSRAKVRIGETATEHVHDVGILAHCQIHQDALRGEEVLHALLHPSGQQGNKR